MFGVYEDLEGALPCELNKFWLPTVKTRSHFSFQELLLMRFVSFTESYGQQSADAYNMEQHD
jgi:hypothetical protein